MVLGLNILVAIIATMRYARAWAFSWAELGSRKLGNVALQRVLALVMLIAALKLIIT